MRRLAEMYGFSYQFQDLTQTSREEYPQSSFTACVHDVSINHTDLCIANFWTTAQRQELTPMTAAISADDFYLITKRKGDLTFIQQVQYGMKKVFQPLSPQLWMWLLLACFYSAFCMFFVHDVPVLFSVDCDHVDAVKFREMQAQARAQFPEVRGFWDDAHRLRILMVKFPYRLLVKRLYLQIVALFRARPIGEKQSNPYSWIIDVGVSTTPPPPPPTPLAILRGYEGMTQ
jgi:hypothetical protein